MSAPSGNFTAQQLYVRTECREGLFRSSTLTLPGLDRHRDDMFHGAGDATSAFIMSALFGASMNVSLQWETSVVSKRNTSSVAHP